MKAMQDALTPRAADKAQFLLVSIDPERDTPQALKAFRSKMHLPAERWMLVTGATDSVRQLAEKWTFNYSAGSKTQFAHSLLITILDGKGEIAHQQAGLGVDRRSAIATLEKLCTGKKSK
jgi:protein SCO1/2